MTVWSLSTQAEDDLDIVTTLYLSEAQAYEGLLLWLGPWTPEKELGADEREFLNEVIKLRDRVMSEGATEELRVLIDALLSNCDVIAVVTRHDHPWVFAEEAA